MGAQGWLPAGVIRRDEDDVEQVGDDHLLVFLETCIFVYLFVEEVEVVHHGGVEGQLLLPLGVLGRPKDAHDGRDDDPRQRLGHDGGEAKEVALRRFFK